MAVCHSGNLVNAPKLRRKLEIERFHLSRHIGHRGHCLSADQNRLLTPTLGMAVSRTMDDIDGAYSLVIMTHTKLIAARDPNGFRPLCIGELPDGNGWAFASESCALDASGREVRPRCSARRGSSLPTTTACVPSWIIAAPRPTRCVFEYIYFARPDSIIEGHLRPTRPVCRAGRFLAQEHPVEADVVIGAPDSGLDAALGYAQESGIPTALASSKQIRRPYLHSGQPSPAREQRAHQAECHFVHGQRQIRSSSSMTPSCAAPPAPVPSACCAKPGPPRYTYRISAPPFVHPCYFGTDIPDERFDCHRPYRGGNQQDGRFRYAGIPEHRACPAAGHPQQMRLLHRLL